MADIPEVFNQPGAAFVLIRDGIKFPPIEKEWQRKGHSFQEAAAHKGNVGIMAGNGYIGLDQDDPAAFDGLELPTCTTWETRPGRFGLWFKASDNVAEALAGIGKKADLAQLKLHKNGLPCGEVKLQRTYQVIPPSWKKLEDGTRADYKLLQDAPPAEISLCKLLADLRAIGITFSSRLDENADKLGDMGKKAHQRRAESDEARSRRYALAALESEVKTLTGTPEGGRNEQLNKSAFSLGQFVAAGLLSEAEVISALSKAAQYAGLEMEEIDQTIKSGLEAGAKHPRGAPEQERPISKRPEPLDLALFAPCMQAIIADAQPTEGRHRALGILATYLYQMGWSEDAAFELWSPIAGRCGVDDRIFDTEFGRVSCPRCDTIQTGTGGYPSLNLNGLGFCRADEHCQGCLWPGDHYNQKILNEMEPPAGEQKLKAEDVCDIEINEDTGECEKITLAPTKASKAILAYFTLAMEKGDDQIYYYNSDGIYDPDGARKIDLALTGAAGDANNNFKLKEVLRRVRNHLLEAPVTFDPDPYLLGVSNGLVDLRTGEFRQYRPGDLITDRIDVAYDPEAKCPITLAYIESLTPCVTTRLMLIDWFAATAIKEPLPYVLFLLGLGRNGKGIYEKLLKKFFGRAAFRDMPLQSIEKSDFAASEFYKKRGWIASETGRGKASIGTDFMKLTSGNGVIDANVKGKSRIQFEPFFQTTVDTNTMPQIADNSIGWRERFSAASLPYVFVMNPDPDNPLEKQRDPHLFEKLTTPSELSGLLNLVIYRAKEIAQTKTITRRSGKEMFAEYQEQSASVGTFLDLFCEHVTDGKDFWTPSTPIYDAYKEWCSYKVGEVVDARYFGKQLTAFCGGKDGKNKDNTVSKIGKDNDRKSVRLYKRLNFDQRRYEEEIKRLRQSMSTSVYDKSTSSLHGIPSTDNDVYIVYIKTWEEIYKRFGDPSKNPIYGRNCENHVEHVDNVDIDSSGGPKVSTSPSSDVDSNVDSQRESVGGDDLTPEQTALLERIKGRLVDMETEVTPFKLAVAMRGNDQDIGIEACRAWLEPGA